MTTGVLPTYWVLVFVDWYKAGADVTVHLKGGGTVSGRVDRRSDIGKFGQVDLTTTVNHREVKHVVDLTEIAAVSAVAR